MSCQLHDDDSRRQYRHRSHSAWSSGATQPVLQYSPHDLQLGSHDGHWARTAVGRMAAARVMARSFGVYILLGDVEF